MMRVGRGLTAFFIFASIGAQPAISAPTIPETVTISAAGGYYDNPRFALPCKQGSLSAVLWLKDLQFEDIWQAAASIKIHSATSYVELGAVTKNQKPDRLYAIWINSAIPQKPVSTDPAVYLLQRDVIQGVRIALDWTEKGDVGGILNGKKLTRIKLPTPLMEISFFVEGAHATFDQITLSCDLTS